MIRVNQIKLPVDQPQNLKTAIAKKINTDDFELRRIVKQSIDARDKSDLRYIYAVDITSPAEKKILQSKVNHNDVMLTNDKEYRFPFSNDSNTEDRPIIIGAGPAGYFAALYLARAGFSPVLYERGKKVDARTKDVECFWDGETISANSNVSFGEGGAGTFSDGKLNTGIKDREGRISAVVRDFISFGAPEEIAYLAKPHIGTDELKTVLHNMRKEILALGGEIHFNSRLTNICSENREISYTIEARSTKTGIVSSFSDRTRALVLAIGHSARDTFAMLDRQGIPMEQKAFAMGLRIEHPAELINKGQYGDSDAASLLPAADYKMTYHSKSGRSVYSFCMCPGGYVVNASSGEEQAVVNGMSYHARDAVNSNAAIVASVTPDDFLREGYGSYGVLAGVEYQKAYEKRAFLLGQGAIPVQRLEDYINRQTTARFSSVIPNIKGKYQTAPLHSLLPEELSASIVEGIEDYDRKLRGFNLPDAVLSGVETRTSSPVRILRDDHLMSAVRGLFPCGEGAGYAGGITSAAVDGIKVAEAVANFLRF